MPGLQHQDRRCHCLLFASFTDGYDLLMTGVSGCYDEEINNLAYYLPCTAINFTEDGIIGGHFEEPCKRMF